MNSNIIRNFQRDIFGSRADSLLLKRAYIFLENLINTELINSDKSLYDNYMSYNDGSLSFTASHNGQIYFYLFIDSYMLHLDFWNEIKNELDTFYHFFQDLHIDITRAIGLLLKEVKTLEEEIK